MSTRALSALLCLSLLGIIGHATYHRRHAKPAPVVKESLPTEAFEIPETTEEKLDRIRRRDAAARTETRLQDQRDLDE